MFCEALLTLIIWSLRSCGPFEWTICLGPFTPARLQSWFVNRISLPNTLPCIICTARSKDWNWLDQGKHLVPSSVTHFARYTYHPFCWCVIGKWPNALFITLALTHFLYLVAVHQSYSEAQDNFTTSYPSRSKQTHPALDWKIASFLMARAKKPISLRKWVLVNLI